MSILLTGFEPFHDVGVNPSSLMIEQTAAQARPGIIAKVLPTAYAAVNARITALIGQFRPDAVIMLGVAARRDAINLERFALNISDAPIPDNDGDLRQGVPIAEGGPVAYRSTLPLEKMHQSLAAHDIPVVYSNHAGAYVCNHVFYTARHVLESMGTATPCGFIHLPMMAEAASEPGSAKGLPLAQTVQAVELCIDVVQSGA